MRFDPTDMRPVRLRFDALDARFRVAQDWACSNLRHWQPLEIGALWEGVHMLRAYTIMSVSKYHGVRPSAAWATPARVEAELRILEAEIEKFEHHCRALGGERTSQVLQ